MTSNDIEKICKILGGHYTEECLNDIIQNVKFSQNKRTFGLKIERCKIFEYLGKKYNLATNCGKGSVNYWIIRGFSEEFAKTEMKKYSSVYNSFSIEAIAKRHNVSIEEAKKIQQDRFRKMNETFNKKTEEEKQETYRKRAQNLENYIRLYGEEEGKRRYEESCYSRSLNCSLKGFIKRYGEEEGKRRYEEYCHKKSINQSLEGYIKRYGEEEGKRRYEEICKNKSHGHTLQGYIENFGEEEGKRRFDERNEKYLRSFKNKTPEELHEIYKKKGINLENMIRKYGEEEGIKRYQKWREKITTRIISSEICEASKASMKVFFPFYHYLLQNGILDEDIYFGMKVIGKHEYSLQNETSFFAYDFTILSKRLIIEFNGVNFHPKSPDDINWKNPYSDITVEAAFTRDKVKRELAESCGFVVLTIWDDISPEENYNFLEEFYEKNCNNV